MSIYYDDPTSKYYDIFWDGYNAYVDNSTYGTYTENPYEHGTNEHHAWDCGYSEAGQDE